MISLRVKWWIWTIICHICEFTVDICWIMMAGWYFASLARFRNLIVMGLIWLEFLLLFLLPSLLQQTSPDRIPASSQECTLLILLVRSSQLHKSLVWEIITNKCGHVYLGCGLKYYTLHLSSSVSQCSHPKTRNLTRALPFLSWQRGDFPMEGCNLWYKVSKVSILNINFQSA